MDRGWSDYDARTQRAKPKPEKTDWFTDNIPRDAEILDFGAGIGRWASLLASRRPDVSIDVLDARAEALESHYKAIPQIKERINCRFEDYRATKQYDGIWARSSLFFLPEAPLQAVFKEMARSLKDDGVLEFSFIAPSDQKMSPLFHPLEKERVTRLVEESGLAVEQVIDEQNIGYGEKGVELPTYIVRARKKG